MKAPEAPLGTAIMDCKSHSGLSFEQGTRNVMMKKYGFCVQRADSLQEEVRNMHGSNNIHINTKYQEWCRHRGHHGSREEDVASGGMVTESFRKKWDLAGS